jgi:hypothetical protein
MSVGKGSMKDPSVSMLRPIPLDTENDAGRRDDGRLVEVHPLPASRL